MGNYPLILLPLERPNLYNPIALRKAKIVYNFGLSECNRAKYPCHPFEFEALTSTEPPNKTQVQNTTSILHLS